MPELTIRDIAAKAGVSVATVSRVINNTGNVHPEIREKVQRVLDETDFTPNISARSLKSKKTFTVAVIVSDISDRYYSLMTKTLADALSQKDYAMIVCCTDNDPNKEKMFFDFLCAKNVDGIILNTSGGLDEEIAAISRKVPLVLVNRKIALPSSSNARFDFIGSDDFSGVEIMTKYLLDRNHKHIGLINRDLQISTSAERSRGFAEAMKQAGIPIDSSYPYCYYGKYDFNTGYKGMEYLTKLDVPPTAVITLNDSIAIGAMQYCHDHNINIPTDISLITYGDIDNAALFAIRPSRLTLSPHTIGQRAVQCLFDRIDNPQCPNREIVFSAMLQEFDSVRRVY